LRDPLRTLGSVGTLAVAIAVATVTWTLVSATLINPLPVPGIGRWVVVQSEEDGGRVNREFFYPAFTHVRDAGVFERTLGAWVPLEPMVLTLDGTSRRVRVGFVSGDFLTSLGIPLQIGRPLTAGDDRPGAQPAAVASDRFWRTGMGASRGVLGRILRLGRGQAAIVGVTGEGFRGLDLTDAPDIYLPLSVIADFGSPATNYFAFPGHSAAPTAGVRILGRLHDGDGAAQASTRLAASAASSQWLGSTTISVAPLASVALKGNARSGVLVFSRMLTVTVALLLLLGCAAIGLGSLMAVEARRTELATCLALGASLWALLRGLALEAAAITGAAAIGALPIAYALLRALRAYSLPGGVRIDLLGVNLDAQAMSACLAVGTLTFVALTGLTGVHAYIRLQSIATLVSGTRGAGAHRARSFTALLAAQVAVALLLLSGARLFVRSLQAALELNASLPSAAVLRGELNLAAYGYSTPRASEFFERWQALMKQSPAIAVAGYAVDDGGMGTRGRLIVDGQPRRLPDIVRFKAVSPDYFAAMGLNVTNGRGPDGRDTASGPPVAIASASLARALDAGGNVVGHAIAIPGRGAAGRLIIIGVVPDVIDDVDSLRPLALYMPMGQRPPTPYRSVILRAAGEVDAARLAALDAARALDRAVAVPALPTLREDIEHQMEPQRMGSALLGVLGTVAVLLTIVSTYVLATAGAVARTSEVGIRLALGAPRRHVVGVLLRGALRPLVVGLAIGLTLVWSGAGALRALLFQVEPTDLWTLIEVVALLTVITVAASLAPAVSASRIDVACALRRH
jgi:predicted permease